MALVRSYRLVLLTGIIVFVLSISGNSQDSRAVEEHFSLAQQDQQKGLLDEAAHEYRAVIRLEPGMPEAYVNLGLVYYAQARFEDSARALATANKLRPGMRGVSLWLGIDSVKLNRPSEGAALLREAIRIDPADKLAQLWLGTALWNEGQIDAALLQLSRAAARFPDDADLIFAKSEAYNKAATEQTKQLLEESVGSSLSDLIYGNIYAEESEWTKAEGHLRRAIERDPRSFDARLKLAHVYLEQGHLAAAKEPLDEAMRLAPNSASALALNGELLLLAKQLAQGLSLIEKALGVDRSEALDALGLPVDASFSSFKADPALLPMCRAAAESLDALPGSEPVRQIAVAALYALAGDENAAMLAYKEANQPI